MRNHLVGLIEVAARSQPDILFLTGDLGFSVVEPLQEYLGPRFINAGVAEANMVSMAASLSFCGFEPYVYSIAPFMTARCYEQIRNDICYHGARVRLIGIGAGYSYGTLGPTHHSLEDATIMATLPNMTVFSPATTSELDRLFALSGTIEGAIYYRIARENGPDRQSPAFDLENPVVVWSEGSAVNLVTSGSLAGEVFAAADILSKEGIDVRLLSLPIIAPFPGEALWSVLAAAPTVVAFEGYDGNPLEAGVGRLLSERGWAYPARFLNARRGFAKLVGGTSFQRAAVGLDVQTIIATVRHVLK
jgi:transketolase